MNLRSRCAVLLILASTATSPFLPFAPEALAADDTARARTLFNEGVSLEAAGNFAQALVKFQEVAQVKRTPQVLFHIALCHEKLGHYVEALGGYRLVAHEAESSGDPKHAKVAETAQKSVADLEKKVPTLTIKRGKGAELAKVSIDGVDMGGTVGKPQQIDPGAHAIEARVQGRDPYKEIVQLAEGEAKTVEIKFLDAPPPKPTSSATAAASSSAPPPPPPPEKASIAPYVVLGAGGASLVLSGVFFLLRSSAKSDLDSTCFGNTCPQSLQSKQDTGKTMTLLGNITLGLGVVGVGVGTVMLLTQKPAKAETAALPPRPKFDLQLRPVAGGMGANFVGQF